MYIQISFVSFSQAMWKHFLDTYRFEYMFRGNQEDYLCVNEVNQFRSFHKAL